MAKKYYSNSEIKNSKWLDMVVL